MTQCFYGCGATEDLRPYGPTGEQVCYDCATSTPERQQAAENAFGAQLSAAAAMSPDGIVIVTDGGAPEPMTRDELNEVLDAFFRS